MNSISLPAGSPLLKNSFLYGTATSSFQIEGDVDNRLECIWDRFCKQPSAIADHSNGDIACEHIVRWKEDFDILLDLDVDADVDFPIGGFDVDLKSWPIQDLDIDVPYGCCD